MAAELYKSKNGIIKSDLCIWVDNVINSLCIALILFKFVLN